MRHLIGTLLLIVLIVVAGCTPATKISNDQVKAFKNDMKNSQESLKDLDVQFRPTEIQIIYTLKENIDEADRLELFTNARELVNSVEFDQEVIQGQFSEKYKSSGYPNIAILFDVNDDGEYDVEYTSIYQADELNTTNELSYPEWYYHRDMSATGELLP
jgi:outer membrane receptor for ferric coprogen and ferric-rhodotorulic acid